MLLKSIQFVSFMVGSTGSRENPTAPPSTNILLLLLGEESPGCSQATDDILCLHQVLGLQGFLSLGRL